MQLENKKVIKNLIYAFSAQSISLFLSILMSLIMPKLLGVKEYSYWQLFLFYGSYAGFFHFGLTDGIYLRIGGYQYEEIDYKLIGTQFRICMFLQMIIAAFIAVFSYLFVKDSPRLFVLLGVAVYLCVFNAAGFLGYLFQAVNRTKIFSVSVMIDRLFFLGVVALLLIFREDRFEIFILFYIVSKAISLLYCTRQGKEVVFSKNYKLIKSLKIAWLNSSIGIKLTLANIASMLILGIGRFIIDRRWGITAFGKFSFALSLTNFFMMFISQVSMVLFPALRQSDQEKQNTFYIYSRNALMIFLPTIFLAYIPMKWLLGMWLPQYSESIRYLALLLPICTLDGKMNILCGTYFKVLRKESLLLMINAVTTLLSTVLSVIGAYVINNVYAIVIFMVVSIAFRSIVSELYLARYMKVTIAGDVIQELIIVVLFMLSTWYSSNLYSGLFFLLIYLLFLFINQNKVKQLMQVSKRVLGKA